MDFLSGAFYLLVNFLLYVSSEISVDPVLKLPQGEIVGTLDTFIKNNDKVSYSVFRGIPYAKRPIGPLRFKDSEKHEGWPSPRDAKTFGPKCPQLNSNGQMIGDEDCLYINVYTPLADVTSSSSTVYPVMVFIHGGNFQKGSADIYQQKKFIHNDVILVTFNYRIGLLGFLSTGDEACPGNLGMKDQVLALQWIRDNIKYFGGNTSSITLFGQDAGAVSVFLHILSPMSQGLFHHAITQSGSPLCDWAMDEHPYDYSVLLAKRLGCSTKSTSGMVDCLRQKSLQEILRAQKHDKVFGDYPLNIAPVVDKNGFLPDTPAKLLKNGDFKPIPLISGVNKDDGTVLHHVLKSYQDDIRRNSTFLRNRMIPMFLQTATDIRDNIQSVSQAIYFHYFNGIDPTNLTQVLQPFINMTTDAMFVSCNYKTLQLYSAKGARVYMYTFEYKGENSMLEMEEGKQIKYDGVSHGDELLYLFDFENVKLTPPFETKKREQFIYLWTFFAKTGASPTLATSEFPKWEPYDSETKYYYKIDTSITRETTFRQRDVDFWLTHLPELSKITPSDKLNSNYNPAGFGWAMFAVAIILLIIAIVLTVILLRKSKGQYFKTKTEDK